MLPPASVSAYNGIQFNLQQFSHAAERIADSGSVVEVNDITNLKLAQQNIELNVAVLQQVDEMMDELIDIVV